MTASSTQAKAELVQERTKAIGSTSETVQRMERFAENAISHRASRFELLQYIAGEGHSRVAPIEITTAREVAHLAYELAHHDAQGFAGVTTYWLVSYAQGADSYTDRCSFRIAAAMLNQITPTESPTAAGLQLQGMRHMEVMAFQYSEGIRNVLREKDLTITDLRTDNAKLREERTMLIDSQMAVIRMREELSNDQTQRQLTLDRERAALAAKEKLHSTFFSLALPILAKRFGGVLPQATAPAAGAATETPAPAPASSASSNAPRLSVEACASVVDFVSSLDEATFGRLLGVLSEEQGAKLVALAAQLNAEAKSE